MNEANSVSLALSSDEALVLFDFLSRFSETKKLQIEDESEQRVLENLLGSLESTLVEPFQSDYLDLLSRAREALRFDV